MDNIICTTFCLNLFTTFVIVFIYDLLFRDDDDYVKHYNNFRLNRLDLDMKTVSDLLRELNKKVNKEV